MYKVIIFCPDCLNTDFQGCFEGGSIELDESFKTLDEAIDKAEDYVKGSIYRYNIIFYKDNKNENN